jgi:Inosine-uridine preferring nucleoside hydrolase
LIVLMGGPLTVVADAYLANPGLISNNVVVYYLGGNRETGDFGEYNSWADGWAAHIVFNRMAMVIFPFELAYHAAEWISVPRARILAELPDTAPRAWMHNKDHGNGDPCRDGGCRDADAPLAVFLDDSGYVTSTLSVCPNVSINFYGHPVPSFRTDYAGECRAVLVTGTDPGRGTERWWATMRQAYGGGGGAGGAAVAVLRGLRKSIGRRRTTRVRRGCGSGVISLRRDSR